MKNFLLFKNTFKLAKWTPRRWKLFIILLLAAFLRFYGLNWDQNHHLHPDERFLTMVTQAIKWPESLIQYLNPQVSPLNPYNANHSFFVYGTLPLKIVKATAEFIKFDQFDYNNITLIGRSISALFDLGTVFLVSKISQKIFNEKIGLLASFFYAISVLPIQLSHFFAVDTFSVFFLTLSFYFLILFISKKSCKASISRYPSILVPTFLGISFGLALACKISALLFFPIITLGVLFLSIKRKNLKLFIVYCLLFIVYCYFSLRLADPRIFANNNFLNPSVNPQFIANIKQLQSFSNPESGFPPSIQWIKTKPIIFPFKNMLLWGLGLPLGTLTTGGIIYSLWLNYSVTKRFIKKRFKKFKSLTVQELGHFLILLWIIFLFLYQGGQFAKPMRYFYPIYPFLVILAANFFQNFILKRTKNRLLPLVCYLLLLTCPLFFITIYSRPHSRVSASKWIYENIPPGAVISCEHWDDCLPLSLDGKSHNVYQIKTLTLYDADTLKKWQKINQQLEKIDYLIMSSNRLWGSIPKASEKYPITAKFYEDLFAEKLNFTKIAEITSYPTLPILNIPIPDDSADESFTVYDHPKVLIFKKVMPR